MPHLLGKILILAASAALPCAALANTTNANGTYTYTISLPNGASFILTQSGSFSTVGSQTLSSTFIGTPMPGYSAIPTISGTGDNSTWAELQFEYGEPSSPGSNTPSSIQSFTFTEPDSFWSTPGLTSFPDDGTTYNGLLYLNLNMDGSFADPGNKSADFVDGTIHQGAWFDTYTPGNSQPDPQCTNCTINITYTPAIVSAVPEPSAMTLLGTGMAAMIGVYRRRRIS